MNADAVNTRWLEQLVYANVPRALGAVSGGYGVAGCSQGWPDPEYGDGGLEKLTTYSTLRDVPRSVVVHQLPTGTVVAIRDPHDHDARGRGSYRVQACLDPEFALHPRQACALTRNLDTSGELPSPAQIGNLPRVQVPDAVRPAFISNRPLEYVVAHLISTYDGNVRTLAIVDADPDAVLELVEQALWCLPASFTQDVRFATWQSGFGSSGNTYGSRLPALHIVGCSPQSSIPDDMDILPAEQNMRHADDSAAALAHALVALAAAGFAVDDTLDSRQGLDTWLARRAPLLTEPETLRGADVAALFTLDDIAQIWANPAYLSRVDALLRSGDFDTDTDWVASLGPATTTTLTGALNSLPAAERSPEIELFRQHLTGENTETDEPGILPSWWDLETPEQVQIWLSHTVEVAGDLDRVLNSGSGDEEQVGAAMAAVADIDAAAACRVALLMHHSYGSNATADILNQVPGEHITELMAHLWPIIAYRSSIPHTVFKLVELTPRTITGSPGPTHTPSPPNPSPRQPASPTEHTSSSLPISSNQRASPPQIPHTAPGAAPPRDISNLTGVYPQQGSAPGTTATTRTGEKRSWWHRFRHTLFPCPPDDSGTT